MSLKEKITYQKFSLFIIIFFINSLSSCSYLQIMNQKPNVQVINTKPIGVNKIAIQFESNIDVENPYTFPLVIDSIYFKFTSEDKKLIESKNSLNQTILAKSKTTLTIPFQVEYADMGLALNDFILKPELNIKFESDITVKFPERWDLPSSYKIHTEKQEKIKLRY